jgi:xylulokinase
MVPLGNDGTVIRPAIIWSDQRSYQQIEEVYTHITREELGKITLNPLYTGFQLASLLWLRENEPEHYQRIDSVVLPKDYLRYALCGHIGTEITDASSTLAFDTARMEWAYELLSRLGIRQEIFPPCGLPTDIAGYVTREAARETGLSEGTPLVYGGADQPMQAIGNGIIKSGRISVTIGTGGQVFGFSETPRLNPLLNTHTFCHALPRSWYILGATLSAGLSMRWFKENILEDPASFENISSLAAEVEPGSEGLVFLPYLTGERTPHLDPHAKAILFGLTLRHKKPHLVRAIMEGVAFSLRESLDILSSLDLPMETIIASGGGARSKTWLQVQADVFGRPVFTTNTIEQACTGAAIVAGVGVGTYRDIEDGCTQVVTIHASPVEPLEGNIPVYEKQYQVYKQLYTANGELFR